MKRSRPLYPELSPTLPPNLSFVFNLSPSAMTLGLGNMQALLERLGRPERRFRSVIVAGTNGKGSVTAYLSSILRANRVRVGLYQSPHVYSVNERIRIGNEPVPMEILEEAAGRIVPLYETIRYSYFEALTAIAFLVFADQGVELAVLETGLGGRFDATNVVHPVLCILTSISLDHRRLLGDSEEEILREKLGITRSGVPLLAGQLSPGLESIVAEKTAREKVPLEIFSEVGTAKAASMSFSGMRAEIRTRLRDYGQVTVPFIGEHQVGNALLSVRAAEVLLGGDVGGLEVAGRAGWLPGRFEVLSIQGKTVILDVAHNEAALVAGGKTLAALSPPENNAVVLGMLSRKELGEFPCHFSAWLKRIYLMRPAVEDACPVGVLLQRIGIENAMSAGLDVVLWGRCETDAAWDTFLESLLHPSSPQGTILVTGSHRTVEVFGRQLRARGFL